jgi:hypothetical protein
MELKLLDRIRQAIRARHYSSIHAIFEKQTSRRSSRASRCEA